MEKAFLRIGSIIPKEYIGGMDLAGFPKLLVGTPEWAIYYKIIRWIDQKSEAVPENKRSMDRLASYCMVKAAKDFADKVASDKEMLGWFTDEAREKWVSIILGAAYRYETGEDGFPCDGESAIFFYKTAVRVDPDELPYPYGAVGDIYYRGTAGVLPNYKKALYYYKRAGYDWGLGDYYSEGLAEAPNYPLAKRHYQKVLDLCIESGNKHGESLVREKLIICEKAIGDDRR